MDTKEYIDKERVMLYIDDAMFKAKSYDGGLNEELALIILNSLKLSIKTMSVKIINEKREVING